MFMFHLTNKTKFLVRVRSIIKRTNTNELPAEQFMKCSLNVQFICNPRLMSQNEFGSKWYILVKIGTHTLFLHFSSFYINNECVNMIA
ncbi:hypothetical protein Hanom_Chr10g00877351 [Helianthus anomalus]